jgi:hypothetical protein
MRRVHSASSSLLERRIGTDAAEKVRIVLRGAARTALQNYVARNALTRIFTIVELPPKSRSDGHFSAAIKQLTARCCAEI